MIRVYLVDSSASVLAKLNAILLHCPDIQVVGMAQNGQQALEAIRGQRPDVLCSDTEMPGLDGLALTRQVMDACPMPILMVAEPDAESAKARELFAAGIVAWLAKPTSEAGYGTAPFNQDLPRKIRVLSGVSVFRRKLPPAGQPAPIARLSLQMLAIGVSTGGPKALELVLSKLPANYPLAIICVQHISQGFLAGFLDWLGGKVKLPVSIAQTGIMPLSGHIYFAPDNANLELDEQGRFLLSQSPDCVHYPSINVTLHSVARRYPGKAIAVLLTGMGDDGVSGLKAIADAGGVTIAQDEASSVVFGMPKLAIQTGAAQTALNLEQIAEALCGQFNPLSERYLTKEWRRQIDIAPDLI